LLVFRLVFCVASRVTYLDMRLLMRLEYEPKSCAIYGIYSESLKARSRITKIHVLGSIRVIILTNTPDFGVHNAR
jgi:hypothetical protein